MNGQGLIFQSNKVVIQTQFLVRFAWDWPCLMSLGEIQENVITGQQTETNARPQLPDLKFLSHFDTAVNGKYFSKIITTPPVSPVVTFYLKFWRILGRWCWRGHSSFCNTCHPTLTSMWGKRHYYVLPILACSVIVFLNCTYHTWW